MSRRFQVQSAGTKEIMNEELEPPMYERDESRRVMATAVDEKRLLRKLDLHILPPLALLYLLCYLDRTYPQFLMLK